MPSFDAGMTGITPGVRVLNPDLTMHTERTTAGITELVAGSGCYMYPHPEPGSWLLFFFDIGDGVHGAGTLDHGLSPEQAAQSALTSQPVALAYAQDLYAPTTWVDFVEIARQVTLDAASDKTETLPASPLATGQQIALTAETRTSLADAVWSYVERALTEIGVSAADVWSHATRTLTDRSKHSLIDEYDTLKTVAQEPLLKRIRTVIIGLMHATVSFAHSRSGSAEKVDVSTGSVQEKHSVKGTVGR